MRKVYQSALVAVGWLAVATCYSAEPDAKGIEFFEKEIRSLLVARCHKCHSRESDELRGGLLLDSREGWAKGGDSGAAIVPGDPDDSLLIQVVRYDDAIQMPPDGKLSDKEIASLVEWVKIGAPDPRKGEAVSATRAAIDIEKGKQHWAFQPLAKVAPPEVADAAWRRTEVDQFILARLNEQNIAPNSIADRRVLIRRVYLDLLGLPPTREEVEAFLRDDRPDAYERLVDRLLDSPHYGERWARHWLDLARFAESHGFEHDYDRPHAYHYRDFVIRALNDDLPYDTFVKWQIAGDEYDPENAQALIATGYLAAGVHSTQITKSQVEKERYDEMDDIVSTISTSLLGLTVSCARCHDHKYDPVPSQDYYRMLSTFTTVVRSEIDVNLDRDSFEQIKSVFDAKQAALVDVRQRYEREELPARFDAWLKTGFDNTPRAKWQTLGVVRAESQVKTHFARLDDGSLLARGNNTDFDTYTLVVHTHQARITGLRLDVLADESLPKQGPGRADNGSFALSNLKVTAAPLSGGEATEVNISLAKATMEQKRMPIGAAIDDDAKSAWSIGRGQGKSQSAGFQFANPIEQHPGGTAITVTLAFAHGEKRNLGRFRLALTTADEPLALDGEMTPQSAAEISAILYRAKRAPTDEDRQAMLRWFAPLDPRWRELDSAVRSHANSEPIPKLTRILVASEGLPAIRLHTQGEDYFNETYFLDRGDTNRKKGVATQGFLQVLMNTDKQERAWQQAPPDGWRTSYRRRALAEWLTDANQGAGHLLARVIVNRLWRHHIGRGIVATPSDFGTQGERPTHPELLDYLASELIRNDWRLKPIHRLIVTSAVYMQGSSSDDERLAVDRENKLLWRKPSVRLEAEVLRDAILACGGLLDREMFGRGTLDANQKRRSIYFTVKRSELASMMMLFDAPDALQGIGQRTTTTVAPQALLLMNNPLVREAAQAMASRLANDGQIDWKESVIRAYEIVLSRPPDDDELRASIEFLDRQHKMLANGGNSDSRLRALADFCQSLMALNEFVYVD